MNIVELFLQQVKRQPTQPALLSASQTLTYQQLDEFSAALAEIWSQKGIAKGDYILFAQPFGINLYVALLALFRLGAVAVVPDQSMGLAKLRQSVHNLPIKGIVGPFWIRALIILNCNLKAKGLSVPTSFSKLKDNIAISLPDEHPALITFTSGSTGAPKAIARSHGFLIAQHHLLTELIQPKVGDVALISLPIFVLSALANGTAIVLPAGKISRPAQINSNLIRQQIQTHHVTRILAPPAFCQRMADSDYSYPQIKQIFTGGGPVFPNLLRSLGRMAPSSTITAVYGSTEAEPISHIDLTDISEADFATMQSGSGLLAGKPIPQIQLKIINDEIMVSGQHVVKSYLNPADDRSTKIVMDNKIWHKTGDAGRLDNQGRLWLLGRLAAKYGSLYPFCVETAALGDSAIHKAGFIHHQGRNLLFVEIKKNANLDSVRTQFKSIFPLVEIIEIAKLPLDRRHNSKIDYVGLTKIANK